MGSSNLLPMEKVTRVEGRLARNGIWVVVAVYAVLGSIYSVVTPVMEASDELWHYPMVQTIAEHWRLPVQDLDNAGPWRQEGSQPPLYYVLAAVLTSWIDTSDLDQVRWVNPHADNGIITEDGNTNLIIHSPRERFPWRGTVLAIHLIRLFSVGLGAGTVYLAYRLVLELWPERRGVALSAAALTGLNPMFCFISGSVNNDNLAMLLGALGIWLLVRLVRRHSGEQAPPRGVWMRDVLLLGAVLGAGALTKTSTMVLMPLTGLAVAYVSWRRGSWWHLVVGGGVTAGLSAAIAGWWFLRNAVLYDGDWFGLERFIVILGYRVPPATWRQLWGERQGFMMAYWGLFGGVNVPLPQWIYAMLNGALFASAVGAIAGALRGALTFRRRSVPRGEGASEGAASNLLARLDVRPHHVQCALLVLWPLLVLAAWAGWAMRTWSSQGRLIFTAITAWSMWMALGLSQLTPRRWESLIPGLMGAFMFGVALWAPLGAIAPAYRPALLPAEVEPTPTHALRADVGGRVRLLGYDIENTASHPGEPFRFTLYWEAQQNMERNWSVFCHVLDDELGVPVSVRDRYPGQGLVATSLLEPGQRWADRYVVWLPETAYAPSEAVLEVGLYDAVSGERPPIAIEQGELAEVRGNALRFQPLAIEPRPGDVANPVHINFGDQLALVGWDVDRRLVASGEELGLTLHWTCLADMDEPPTASAQVLHHSGGKVAQSDVVPRAPHAAGCAEGSQIVDRRELTISPDAQTGTYQILISVYGWDALGELQRVRIINTEGRVLPRDSWTLGQVRVLEAGP